ncbi:MAG TPA: acetate/propionate family kinase [Agitococcus sp.]|nr:acetate/propionate family kinase [Agitococcus sp.]
MQQLILTFNVGSSSLKFSCYQQEKPLFSLNIDLKQQQFLGQGQFQIKNWTPSYHLADDACFIVDHIKTHYAPLNLIIAHRVVHGAEHQQAVMITPDILQELEALSPLCPLHQPPALTVINAIQNKWPDIQQIAAFDTSFHQSQSRIARSFALPKRLTSKGIKRYGFHGLSCQSIIGQLANTQRDKGRVIVAHLGNGSSITAIKDGVSQASSMSFSTLDGLPMGTRCGHLDAGVMLYLVEQGWTAQSLTELLYYQSGLLGLSGISSDMRVLMDSQETEAKFAIDYFVDYCARTIASMATTIQGIDRLVFTGGIGEHQSTIRANIVEHLTWLGLKINPQANEQHSFIISTDDSTAELLCLPTNEQEQLFLAAKQLVKLSNDQED